MIRKNTFGLLALHVGPDGSVRKEWVGVPKTPIYRGRKLSERETMRMLDRVSAGDAAANTMMWEIVGQFRRAEAVRIAAAAKELENITLPLESAERIVVELENSGITNMEVAAEYVQRRAHELANQPE